MKQLGPRAEVDFLDEELNIHRSRWKEGNHKLHCGYSQKGVFSLKEAHTLLIQNNMDQEDKT